jgi:hypothetical protein
MPRLIKDKSISPGKPTVPVATPAHPDIKQNATYRCAPSNLIELEEVPSVTLGVSLHIPESDDAKNERELKLWVENPKNGTWQELSGGMNAAVRVKSHGDLRVPVRFTMSPRSCSGALPIHQIRVFDPMEDGRVLWHHDPEWKSAEILLILARHGDDDDEMVESQFKVRVFDGENWWGKDPYIQISRVMEPPPPPKPTPSFTTG